jgi:hypothetical protein
MTDLELLHARGQIADLINQYARSVRDGDYAACVSLFTEDATFEVRMAIGGQPESAVTRARLTGRAELLSYLTEAAAASGGMCPLISTVLIEVQGAHATSNCMMTATVWDSGKTVIGEYHDAFRFDGKWQFTARLYTIWRPRS